MHPYHHHHSNVEEVSWRRLGGLLVQLAEAIRANWLPEVVVGIAKGGVIPAAFLSSALRLDFFPIKLSSRRNEEIVSENPIWYVYPVENFIKGRKVILVDDISVGGRTLTMATEELRKQGAREIRTATLAIHNESFNPDYTVLKTDALIVWPWDRDTFTKEGSWAINPEYLEEMKEVPGYTPGPTPAVE